MGKKQRKYNCPGCGEPLTEGLEYVFPPRLSYWYCKKCQLIFKEIDIGQIVAYAPIAGNENVCKQDMVGRGCVYHTLTGVTTYPDDLPALEVKQREMRNDKKLDIKCKLCGGDLIMGACATECMNCGASVHPGTGESYRDGDKTVKVGSFGGRNIP